MNNNQYLKITELVEEKTKCIKEKNPNAKIYVNDIVQLCYLKTISESKELTTENICGQIDNCLPKETDFPVVKTNDAIDVEKESVHIKGDIDNLIEEYPDLTEEPIIEKPIYDSTIRSRLKEQKQEITEENIKILRDRIIARRKGEKYEVTKLAIPNIPIDCVYISDISGYESLIGYCINTFNGTIFSCKKSGPGIWMEREWKQLKQMREGCYNLHRGGGIKSKIVYPIDILAKYDGLIRLELIPNRIMHHGIWYVKDTVQEINLNRQRG